MKKILLISLIFMLSFLLQSHEFWLQPNKFNLQTGESFSLDIRVGEEYHGALWEYSDSRIINFKVFENSGKIDLTDKAKKGKGNNLTMAFKTPGTKLIALETNSAFITLESKEFNSYLIEDGLLNVLRHRNQMGLLEKNTTENYARNVKTLLNVGNKYDETYRTITGMPLEIIPSTNPYAIDKLTFIEFKVLFNGNPLNEALVSVWHKTNDEVSVKKQWTDTEGNVIFQINPSGKWMISVVTMIPSKEQTVDWQSYWSSLTFGYE
ncbi:MAG: DUF4198 domain-containing protein [Flavobacteriaceae bacterium]|nr:DUF4198 domain-containing protein [Flavobacteriaceae bacterium]